MPSGCEGGGRGEKFPTQRRWDNKGERACKKKKKKKKVVMPRLTVSRPFHGWFGCGGMGIFKFRLLWGVNQEPDSWPNKMIEEEDWARMVRHFCCISVFSPLCALESSDKKKLVVVECICRRRSRRTTARG
jgi:hypothetical protein